MKYLILCPSDKRIMHISTTLQYNKVGGLILDSGLHIAPNIAEVAEVNDVPSYVEIEKYLFVNGEYVLNPNYENEVKEDEEENR